MIKGLEKRGCLCKAEKWRMVSLYSFLYLVLRIPAKGGYREKLRENNRLV